MANDPTAQPPPLTAILDYGTQNGIDPEKQADAVQKWRDQMSLFGEHKLADSNPEVLFRGNMQMERDAAGALKNLQEAKIHDWASTHFDNDQQGYSDFIGEYKRDPASAAQMNPDAATSLDGIIQNPKFRPRLSSNQFTPITGQGNSELGVYNVQKGQDGKLNVLVHVRPPDGNGEIASTMLKVDPVTSFNVIAASKQAQEDQQKAAQEAVEFGKYNDPSSRKPLADAKQREADSAARALMLSGPVGKSALQQERIVDAFKKSPLAARAGEWGILEDIQRSMATVGAGVDYAMASTFGSDADKAAAMETIKMLPEVLPGTTRPTTGAQFARGVADMSAPVAMSFNPVSRAVMLESQYGNSVAQADIQADAAEKQAAALKDEHPELASQFDSLADHIRTDAKLYGAATTATYGLMGKLMPQARSVLGRAAMSSAEWASINAVTGQVLDPAFLAKRQDPMNILEGALIGFVAGGTTAKAREVMEAKQAAATAPTGSATGAPPDPNAAGWTGATAPPPPAGSAAPPPGPAGTPPPPPPGPTGSSQRQSRASSAYSGARPPPGQGTGQRSSSSQGQSQQSQQRTGGQSTGQSQRSAGGTPPPPGPQATPPPPKGPAPRAFNSQAEFNAYMDNASKSGDVEQASQAFAMNPDSWRIGWVKTRIKQGNEYQEFINSVFGGRSNAEHASYAQAQADARKAQANPPQPSGTGGGQRTAGPAPKARAPEPAPAPEPARAAPDVEKPPETPQAAPEPVPTPTPEPAAPPQTAPISAELAPVPAAAPEAAPEPAAVVPTSTENATPEGIKPQDNQPQHQQNDAGGNAPEASSSDSTDESRKVSGSAPPSGTPPLSDAQAAQRVTPDKPERVMKIAVLKDGNVFYSRRPTQAYPAIEAHNKADGGERGFMTSTGRFVSPAEAAKIAGIKGTGPGGALTHDDLLAARPRVLGRQSEESRHFQESHPILTMMGSIGGLMSKTNAQKRGGDFWAKNKSLWDDAPRLAHPTHNAIYSSSGGLTPDQMAQELHTHGIGDGTTEEMWKMIDRESKGAVARAQQERDQRSEIAGKEAMAGKQTADFKATTDKPSEVNKKPVDSWDLNAGDTVWVDGEPMKVKDTESGDVLLEDGTRFGSQILETGEQIYVEKVDKKNDLELETQTDKDIADEQKQGDLEKRAGAPLAGSSGEHGTADMFDTTAGETPLFSQPERPSRQVIDEAVKLGHPVKMADLRAHNMDVPPGYYAGPDGVAHPGNEWTEATDGSVGTDAGNPAPPGRPPENPSIVFNAGIPIPQNKIHHFTNLDKATSNRSAKLQRSVQDARRAASAIQKVAPTEKLRNALTLYSEAGGDMGKLGKWATAKPAPAILKTGGKKLARAVKNFNDAAKAAMSLTPAQIDVANKMRDTFNILHARGTHAGVINAFRDNYVPHVWDLGDGPSGFGGRGLKKAFRFAKARTYDTVHDGVMDGMLPATMDASKLLPAYLGEINRVIADRQFVQEVSRLNASDGRPLVIPKGYVQVLDDPHGDTSYLVMPRNMGKFPFETRDYKTMDNHPALEKWVWRGEDPGGNPIFMNAQLAVHPDLHRRLNAMMGQSGIREWWDSPSGDRGGPVPKAIVKFLLETVPQGMKREMFSLLAPFHQVQEGTHAIGHTVNPFFGLKEIDLRTPRVKDAVQHGLMLETDKKSFQSHLEGVGAGPTWLTQGLRKIFLGKASDVIEGYQEYLFNSYIPRLKYTTYEHILSRNMRRMRGTIARGEATEADVKFLSAMQANAAFGHLNYALLDRNPTMQHMFQLLALAPDFLEARARFVGQATRAAATGPRTGDEQMRAIVTLALAQAGTMALLAYLTGGKYDKRKPFEFQLGNRSITARSVPEDLFRLASDTYGMASGKAKGNEFVTARINPGLASAWEVASGLNHRGEHVTTGQALEEAIGKFIPITARQLPGLRQLNESTNTAPVSPLQQLAGSFGLKISRFSPITGGYEIANKWKKEHGIASDYAGTYPVSKYQQLRYAIEDGDLDRAAVQYNKLLTGENDAQLSKGFVQSVRHPFTGSKANDARMHDDVNAEDKAILEAAHDRREMILNSFSDVVDRAEKLRKTK